MITAAMAAMLITTAAEYGSVVNVMAAASSTTKTAEKKTTKTTEAIINMFENDHSAARGKMAVRELIVFKHSKELGDCPAYKLFDAVEVTRKEEIEYPRKYQDYIVEVHNDRIPDSVEVQRMI